MMKKSYALLIFLLGYFELVQNQYYDCNDSVEYALDCPIWAKYDECIKSYDFMKQYCQKSCNFCPSK